MHQILHAVTYKVRDTCPGEPVALGDSLPWLGLGAASRQVCAAWGGPRAWGGGAGCAYLWEGNLVCNSCRIRASTTWSVSVTRSAADVLVETRFSSERAFLMICNEGWEVGDTGRPLLLQGWALPPLPVDKQDR